MTLGGAGTHTGHTGHAGAQRDHRPHRRTSQPSKPTNNTQPAHQRDDRNPVPVRGVCCWWVWLVVRLVCVPLCVRVSRVSRVCPGSPRCLFTGTVDCEETTFDAPRVCSRCGVAQPGPHEGIARAAADGCPTVRAGLQRWPRHAATRTSGLRPASLHVS
jgi:hypothetical protein